MRFALVVLVVVGISGEAQAADQFGAVCERLARATPARDPFENDSTYQAKLATLPPQPVTSFRLRTARLAYNPQAQRFEPDLALVRIIDPERKRSGEGVEINRRVTVTGSRVGENAFGARREISEQKAVVDVLAFTNLAPLHKSDATFEFPREIARKIAGSIALEVVVQIGPADKDNRLVIIGMKQDRATITDPVDLSVTQRQISGRIVGFRVIDTRTGRTLAERPWLDD